MKAEAEVRVAQADFDRQVEVTRLLLEGISSTHVRHLHSLFISFITVVTGTVVANACDISLTLSVG